MTHFSQFSKVCSIFAVFAASSFAAPVYFIADAVLPTGLATLQAERAAWASGAGSLTQNGFEAPFTEGSNVDFGAFSMTSANTPPGLYLTSGNNLITTEGTDVITFVTTGNTSVTFAFDAAIQFFGIDITSIDYTPTTISFLDNLGNELTSFNTFPGSAGATFFGVQNDQAFNSVVFSFTGSEILNFDNLQYGNAGPAAVPEPGTLAFMGLGLVGLGFVRRRKKTA
jgi:hypothetical protein